MDSKRLPDWRVAMAVEVAADTHVPGLGTLRKGDIGVATSTAEASMEGRIAYPVPSAPALALKIAIENGRSATILRRTIGWRDNIRGVGRPVGDDQVAKLFDFFQMGMIAATFAFQALESNANQIIADEVKTTFNRKRGNKIESCTADALARRASTEEKLATILPTLLRCASPKAMPLWSSFLELKGVRDATVHLKALDTFRPGTLDRDSLFARLLSSDVRLYPRTAIKLLHHFARVPRMPWLDEAELRLSRDDA
jgi:hypothetical protein